MFMEDDSGQMVRLGERGSGMDTGDVNGHSRCLVEKDKLSQQPLTTSD